MRHRTKSKAEYPIDAHTSSKNELPINRHLNREYLVSVVIPATSSARNLPYVLPYIPEWVHEVVLVDRHSTDNTLEVARELHPNILIVVQEGSGKGNALRTGFAAATGDIVVVLDTDGSTDPGEIPAFVGALLSDADFAKGSRFLRGGDTTDMPLHGSVEKPIYEFFFGPSRSINSSNCTPLSSILEGS